MQLHLLLGVVQLVLLLPPLSLAVGSVSITVSDLSLPRGVESLNLQGARAMTYECNCLMV